MEKTLHDIELDEPVKSHSLLDDIDHILVSEAQIKETIADLGRTNPKFLKHYGGKLAKAGLTSTRPPGLGASNWISFSPFASLSPNRSL